MDAAAQPALKDALIAIPDINVESHTHRHTSAQTQTHTQEVKDHQQPHGAAAAE